MIKLWELSDRMLIVRFKKMSCDVVHDHSCYRSEFKFLQSSSLSIYEMVFVSRRQQSGGRRVGQAMNGNLVLDSNFDEHVAQQIANDAVDAQDLGNLVTSAGDASISQDATSTFGVFDLNNGAQLAVQVPNVPAAAEANCEFPAQDLLLERRVDITNTTPQVINVETDVCGNVISYTENMTRQMRAGPWVPLSGMQAGVNGVANLQVGPGGVVQQVQNDDIILANSLSQPQFPPGVNVSVNPAVRVGKRVGARNNYNANASYGASLMRKFRSA